MIRKFKRFFRKIKSICFWIPHIWRDEDYDSYFLLNLMKLKIDRMIEYSENTMPDFYEGQNDDLNKMKRASYLIQRINDDNYFFDGLSDDQKAQFENKIDIMTGKRLKSYDDNYDDIFKLQHSVAHLERDHDKYELFMILNDEIEKWWI